MNSLRKLLVGVASMAFASLAAGCGGNWEVGEAGEGESVGQVQQAMAALPWHGSKVGNYGFVNSYSLSGIRVKSGSRIDAANIYYYLQGTRRETGFKGGSGGQLRDEVRCTSTDKVIGYFGHESNGTLKDLCLRCENRTTHARYDVGSCTASGTLFREECPSGSWVYQLGYYWNDYFQGLAGFCS